MTHQAYHIGCVEGPMDIHIEITNTTSTITKNDNMVSTYRHHPYRSTKTNKIEVHPFEKKSDTKSNPEPQISRRAEVAISSQMT